MRVARLHLPLRLLFVALLLTGNAYADTLSIALNPGTTVSAGQQLTVTVSALTAAGVPDPAFVATGGTLAVTTTDNILRTSPAFVGGTATFNIVFNSAGTVTLTVSNAAATPASAAVAITVSSTIAGCSSCFASIGAGAVITSPGLSDYAVNNNILETTSLDHSRSTPQYLAGVAYKLPIQNILFLPAIKSGKPGVLRLYRGLSCAATDFNNPGTEAKAAYCYPYKAFISFKFTPDASQTFNGFTYGFTFALHKDLDILVGDSYSPYSNISGGFQSAAIALLKNETGNRCYSQWTVAGLSASSQGAFNGFPTQLLTDSTPSAATPTCSAGSQIYSGSVTTQQYHNGFFLGISVPIGLSSFLK